MKEIEIKKGENVYTTPAPDFKYSGKYICINCNFTGTKREVLNHKCKNKKPACQNRQ